jgi:MFS family permease
VSTAVAEISEVRRWTMLAVSTTAQAAAAVTIHGPAFLIPVLHERHGLSLTEAAAVAAAPMVGVMCTLVLWGFVVDRRGERFVLLSGLGGTALAGVVSTRVDGMLPGAW